MTFAVAIPILAFLGYVGLFTAFRLGNPDLPPFGGDTTAYHFPVLAFLRHSFQMGEIPLWNPYQLAGTPFLALHTPGLLYPLQLVFAPLPSHVALVAHAALHLFLAGWLTWLFAKHVGLCTAGSIAAGLAFLGSTQLTGSANQCASCLSTLVWLPGVLWAIRRLALGARPSGALLLAGALSLAFFGGYSQGFLFIAQAAVLYGAYLLATLSTWEARGRATAWLCTAAVVALGVVSLQLLPTLHHAASASRNLGGLTLEQVAPQGLSDAEIWKALTGRGEGWLALPVLSLPLIAAALAARRFRREACFFLVLLLLGVDFMRGREGLLLPLYYQLPYGDLFRLPIRVGFVTDFAVAMLAGIGVTAIASRLRATPAAAPAALLLVLGIGVDVFHRNVPPYRFDPLAAPEVLAGPDSLADFATAIGHDRIFVLGPAIPIKFGQVHRAFVVPDYDPLLPGLYAAFFGIPSDRIWHGQLDVVPRGRVGRDREPWTVQSPALLDLLSVRYYADGRPAATRRARPLAALVQGVRVSEGPPAIYERDTALPRAYVVHQLVRAASEAEALERVRAGDFDARKAAVVHEAIPPLEAPVPGASERATIVRHAPQHVTVEARCASACLLVYTDLYDPDWRVRVDGEPARLLRANFLLRGVRLGAGQHRVDFSYESDAIRLGALVSAGSILVAVGVAGVARMRRRQGPEPP